MILNLITFSSTLQQDIALQTTQETVVKELSRYATVVIVDYKNIKKLTDADFCIVFIATGGVERFFVQSLENLPRPFVLLANGMQNSLAAALEISTWLRQRGMKSEILHGEPPFIERRIKALYNNFLAQRSLTGKRIGVIGTPAPWLIASGVDYLLAKRRWGIQYIDISLDKIYKLYDKITDDEVGQASADFAGNAVTCMEGSPEDMLKAMRFYRALKQICEKENLNAITLSCFKVIERTGTTGCLALSLLNDEGLMAGCEGDLQSIFTLTAIQSLTGQTGFMANPALIDSSNHEVTFAHCSIGTKQTEKYIIRSHFESGKGIAIQGILPQGEVTIVKCGGESLDEYYVTSGILIDNTNYINMCRTQVLIKLNSRTDYFLKNPLGNHHIIIQGNYVNTINEFFSANGCKRIE